MNIHIIRSPAHRWLRGRTAVLLALAFAAVALGRDAHAAEGFWYGVSGSNWSTATNWNSVSTGTGSYTLVNGDSLRWFGSSTANKTSYNDLTGLSVAGLSFQGGVGPFVLNGNKLTLTSGINQVTTSVALNLPLELNVATVSLVGGASQLTINGIITEIGGSRGVNLQSGTAILTGSNSFSGGMIIGVSSNSAFSVNALANIGVAQPLGTGTTIELRNGSIIYTGTTASTDRRILIGRNAAGNSATTGFTNNGTGAVTWTGSQALGNTNTNSSSVFTLGGSNTGDNTWQSGFANNTSSGTVGITKTGAGKWILSGSNTYTGATTISGGTLTIGSGGTAGSIGSTSGVSVAAGATLAFNRTDSYGGNFTRAISGSGGLLLQGGALTLAAAQTYTGATTISGGTLALGSGGSFANSSRIVVGDAGSSGAALDLSAISSLSIGAGQTLQGIGTALLGPSTALTVSGTFSPGNSPGLFTFDGGSTTLAGTTLLEIWGTGRGTGYDAVNVIDSGLVTLGGTLVLDFNQNFSDAASFTLFDTLTSGSLAGGFSGITITGSNNDYTGLSFTQAGSVWTTGYNSNNQGLRLTQTASSVALDVIVVPEPGTIALAGLGVGLVGFAAWKRRRVGG